MQTITDPSEMQLLAIDLKKKGNRIGVVPTMGYLHEGHLSLIRISRRLCDFTITTIFVNPTQFGPTEDLDKYPRDFEHDKQMCANEQVDCIFHPEQSGIYNNDHSIYVVDESMSSVLCGASRPGHFRGVLTIVAKLFNITLPDIAVFGQKDAQQAALIQRMTRDLNFPVEVTIGPIVREPDGLAMSSRNKYLSDRERADATCLSRALRTAEDSFQKGVRECSELKRIVEAEINKMRSAEIEYVQTVSMNTLQPATAVHEKTLLAVAARFGNTRLIDNTILSASSPQTQEAPDLSRP